MSGRLPVQMTYCSKCGAEPGKPCRTRGGNRTTFHKVRYGQGEVSRGHHRQGARLECWRWGWSHGVSGSTRELAEEASSSYIYPDDYLKGWEQGSKARDEAFEAARSQYMAEVE